MIKIQTFIFNPFYENTYVVYDETNTCVIIDPGCYEKSEQNELLSFIKSHALKVAYLLNTHCHVDHVLGNQFVKDIFHVSLYAHTLERDLLKAVTSYAPAYGFALYHESTIDNYLMQDDIIRFGNTELKTVWLPGHTPGHLAFYTMKENVCFSGDVLFRESIGRTDLPGGNFETLINSIQTKLFHLPDSMCIYSGHGEPTTIGYEKINNPFCKLT